MTKFEDIFKKAFLEGYSSNNINVKYAVIALLVTCVIALYIFFIYRFVTRKTFYSKGFSISLAVTAVVTAAIVFTVQSSIVISLGMVGALSIVRFRTAIKEPMDLAFVFWSISVGIICGAGLAEIAVVLSLIVSAGIIILDRLPMAKSPMILVLNIIGIDAEESVIETMKQYTKYYKIKSRNMSDNRLDMVIELRVKNDKEMMKAFSEMKEVNSVSLLAHDGEVTF